MNKKLSKNFYITNITKNSEISKFISTFLKYFLYDVSKTLTIQI